MRVLVIILIDFFHRSLSSLSLHTYDWMYKNSKYTVFSFILTFKFQQILNLQKRHDPLTKASTMIAGKRRERKEGRKLAHWTFRGWNIFWFRKAKSGWKESRKRSEERERRDPEREFRMGIANAITGIKIGCHLTWKGRVAEGWRKQWKNEMETGVKNIRNR